MGASPMTCGERERARRADLRRWTVLRSSPCFMADPGSILLSRIQEELVSSGGSRGYMYVHSFLYLSMSHAPPMAAAPTVDLLPGALRIPRRSALSLQAFFEEYADLQTPVIVTDYTPSFANMTRANIRSFCGSKIVALSRRASKPESHWAGMDYDYDTKTTLGDFMDKVDGGHKVPRGVVGIFDWPIPSFCVELLSRHFLVPKYVAQDFLQRVPARSPMPYRDVAWPSLFVGVDGSYGLAHFDMLGFAFWQYVIEGEKEWHIAENPAGSEFNPEHAPGIDFFRPDGKPSAHPTQYHDVVRAGELLLMPGNRLHQARNLGTTLSLTGNYVSRGSLITLRAALSADEARHGFLPDIYQTLNATLLHPDFDTKVDLDGGDLSWAAFKAPHAEAAYIEAEKQASAAKATSRKQTQTHLDKKHADDDAARSHQEVLGAIMSGDSFPLPPPAPLSPQQRKLNLELSKQGWSFTPKQEL